MLEISNCSFGYTRKKDVLHNLFFTLNKGITLLIGENGSGKSTLMKLVSGSLSSRPAIQIYLDGEVISDRLRKQRMAYLPQEFDVFPSMKVSELLYFIADARGIHGKDREHVVLKAANQTHIENYLKCKMKQCSVGTKRRVGIATTLVGNCDIVLLDEPTAGIDPKERSRFYHMIRECYSNKTILLASHILDDMEILADHVLMLSEGKIAFTGDYYSFRHALDGKVYQVDSENFNPSESNVLSTGKIDGKEVFHIFLKSEPTTDKWQSVPPTLEDIWRYYQQGGSDA